MRPRFVSPSLFRSSLTSAAACLAMVASAGPINYASHSVGIRAGIAITNSNLVNGVPANSAPFVWLNLDRNTIVKPAGWNFYNPHAASYESAAMAARWSALDAVTGGSPPLTVNSPLNKATAGYWEVPLSQISDTTINDYDVLLLPVYNHLILNAAERSRLEKFVDKGGVLWIDVTSGVATDDGNGAPLSFSVINASNKVASVVNQASQIFRYPYSLSSIPEATYNSALGAVNLGADGYGTMANVLGPVLFEFNHFEASATDGLPGSPTVATARLGNGAIVVTARGVAGFLNQVTLNGMINPNVGFTAFDATPDANSNQVARFAINMVSLVNGSDQDSQGSRKTSGTPIDIGAPLLSEWKDENTGGSAPTATPVTYKGLVLVAGVDRLYAYSAVPGSDLDFDGNPDDGLQDYSAGKGRDLIWESPVLNGPLSAPAAVEVPSAPAGRPTDVICVVDHNGNLLMFNAFPLVGGSFPTTGTNPVVYNLSPPNGASDSISASDAHFGPTVHDGLVYVTDNVNTGFTDTGRVWVADPSTGGYVNSGPGEWAVGGSLNSTLPQASAGVTIGDIPIADNSGGVDRIVYMPVLPSGLGGGSQTCGIVSIWSGTKGEVHSLGADPGDATDSTGTLAIPTRGGQNRPLYLPTVPDPRGIHVTLLDANGNAIPIAVENTLIGGTPTADAAIGGVDVPFAVGATQAAFTSAGVAAVAIDYSLDWNFNLPNNGQLVRGAIHLPDDSNRTKVILGNLALSPAGTLYAVEADPGDPQADGMFFALREQGQGAFVVVTRFDLYDTFTLSTPGATTATNTTIPATFEDNDPTQSFAPGILTGALFTGLEFESGPAVADGRVFVKARGYKIATIFGNIKIPCMLMLCFNAEPQLPTFKVPVLQPGFTIFQADYNRSLDKTQPEQFTQVSSSQVTYTQGVDHASISMDSLATTQRNQISQTLSESLPIIIRQPGQPDLTLDPSTVGVWSSLQWYTTFYGIDPGMTAGAPGGPWQTGAPVITGNTVFAAGNSLIPYVFQGVSPVGKSPVGMIVGYNAGLTGATDSFAVNNGARPYFTQITQVKAVPSFSANPDLEWPQNANSSSFAEYRQRLYQTVLDGANLNNHPTCYGLAAGEGGLFAYSDEGVYGFKRANFTVADAGRLASFDPGGNALWTTDSSLSYGIGVLSQTGQNNPALSRPLVQPTRAYPIGSSDYLVVDPGSNRIARIDAGGREIRSIDGFSVDPNFQPDGYISGEPFTFNQPQDVLTYSDYQIGTSPFTNAQPVEYWRHYVVADTGNRRLLEIVDRYNVDPASHQPTTPLALGVLYYHSPSSLSGKKGYDYNSIARVLKPGTGTAGIPAAYIYAVSIGSSEPTGVGVGLDAPAPDQLPAVATAPFQARDARDGNGGILVMNGASTQVINQVWIPPIAANIIAPGSPAILGHYKKLGGLSSVTMSYSWPDGTPQPVTPTIMFTDSTGVYEIQFGATTGSSGLTPPQDWTVDWMMPAEVYEQLRRDATDTPIPSQNPMRLKATYARRTAAGTVILVNSYFGTYQDQSAFPGEIIELDGSLFDPTSTSTRGFSLNQPYLGFDSLSVQFQLPSVQGARGIVAPIFADRR